MLVFLAAPALAQDADGDGFPMGVDCDDTDPAISPGAAEVVGDNLDQDCNGQELCWVDGDDDGARGLGIVASADPDCDDAFEATTGAPVDCDDADPFVAPGAPEHCDGVDNDCDGVLDPVWLSAAVPAQPGVLNDWAVTGGPPSEQGHLVVGANPGLTFVPGCPDLAVGLANPRRVGAATTDAAGGAVLSAVAPAGVAGRDVHAQVVFPASCVASCISITPFP